MRTPVIGLVFCLVLSGAGWCAEPDYKALYLKANESARLWKAQAEQLAAQLQTRTDQLFLAEARARQRQKLLQPVAAAEAQARRKAEQDEQERVQHALTGARYLIAGTVLSVEPNGVIVQPGGFLPPADNPWPLEENFCFVELDSSQLVDHDIVNCLAALDGAYEFTKPNGMNAKVRRYYCVLQNYVGDPRKSTLPSPPAP